MTFDDETAAVQACVDEKRDEDPQAPEPQVEDEVAAERTLDCRLVHTELTIQ